MKPYNILEMSTVPGERVTDKPELPSRGIASHLEADIEAIEGEVHLKRGISGGWEIFSDEPEVIGGTNRYPAPMRYVALGIGFCLLTQVARYASMMKMEITKATCHVELDALLSGSVLKGTVTTTWHGVRTDIVLESDEPEEKIVRLVRTAKAGCFAENLVAQPVPLQTSLVHNGRAVEFAAD